MLEKSLFFSQLRLPRLGSLSASSVSLSQTRPFCATLTAWGVNHLDNGCTPARHTRNAMSNVFDRRATMWYAVHNALWDTLSGQQSVQWCSLRRHKKKALGSTACALLWLPVSEALFQRTFLSCIALAAVIHLFLFFVSFVLHLCHAGALFVLPPGCNTDGYLFVLQAGNQVFCFANEKKKSWNSIILFSF